MANLQFSHKPGPQRFGLVACLDISGFSEFCKEAEGPDGAPRLIANLFDMLAGTIDAHRFQLSLNQPSGLLEPSPTFTKFTGDGALVIWTKESDSEFSQEFLHMVVVALRHFRIRFNEISTHVWRRQWRSPKLPNCLRVGMAIGPLFPLFTLNEALDPDSKPSDYLGYPINLAVRLQGHLPELGFVVQERVASGMPELKALEAIGLKGCHNERVLVVGEDWDALGTVKKQSMMNGRVKPID